jgi:hypothetical protein
MTLEHLLEDFFFDRYNREYYSEEILKRLIPSTNYDFWMGYYLDKLNLHMNNAVPAPTG